MIWVTPCAAAATGMPGCKSRSGSRREVEGEVEEWDHQRPSPTPEALAMSDLVIRFSMR